MRLAKAYITALLILLSVGAYAESIPQNAYNEALARKPDTLNGEQLFAACAVCHGRDGGGVKDGTVPAIAGQHWQVLSKQLLDFRYFRRWDPRMVNLSSTDHLRGPQEIADVVAYINSLPPPSARGIGTGEYADHGAGVYTRLCASCHGAEAKGDGTKGYPRLAGQQYAYLVRQIHDAVEGRRPTFSHQHIRLLEPLDFMDIQGIADYLARLEPRS
ncbi:MAG: c-type cytochrome [Pseudomonadota bacterium]